MRGIAFRFDAKSDAGTLESAMQRCLYMQHHRGPDALGIEVGAHFVIGPNRLSILDLGGGKQPMVGPCQRYLLAFNGEICISQALRKELSEWPFSTNGDTGVLMAGLILR